MAEKNSTSDNIKIGLYIFGGYLLYQVYKNFKGKDQNQTGAPESINCEKLWNSGTLSRDKSAYYNDADTIEVAVNGAIIIIICIGLSRSNYFTSYRTVYFFTRNA